MRKKYFTDEERKEAKSQIAKRYYATEKGKAKKNEYDKTHRALKKDELLAYRQARRKTKNGYADRFMERAKLRTPDTDLTREYLLSVFGSNCAISGMAFDYEKSYDAYHNALAPSIDRIDSKRGYYRDNIQIILSCINRMKNDMPNEQFLKLWSALVD